MRVLGKYAIAAAAVLAAMFVDVAPGHAFGDAPWCAVIEIGDGEVYWDCQYRTVEECVPNVVAGNRGFCNVNPYGPGPSARAPTRHRHHRESRARR